MIETIHSNESGEANRINKVQAAFKMPKNIRQVGKINATKRIYVEDYVMTYIKQLAGNDFSQCKIAVLVGHHLNLENGHNIFISGALEVHNIETTGEIIFSNDTWTEIYETIKKYFVESEIVGWFIGGPGYLLEDEEKILKAHINNFAGQDKTLLTYDNMEKEEAFLIYENNGLKKQDGYYIYYEKNEEMQTYMIDHKKPQSNEVNYEDRVSKEIRTVIQNKKPVQEESRNVTRLMYAAGTLLAVIILVVGAAMLSNYDQMKNMQTTLNYLTKNMQEVQTMVSGDFSDTSGKKSAQASKEVTSSNSTVEDEESVNVEIIPGEVEKLQDNTTREDDSEEEPSHGEELAGGAKDKDATENDETADIEVKSEAKPTKAAEKKSETQVVQKEIKYYIVQSGDTLADISYKLYNTYTKVKEIMELNNIENQDIIWVGQKLIVP